MTGDSLTANREVKHIQWAFALDDAPHLPLTGENHPLRRELAKWMSWANLVTILMAAAIFGGWYFWSHRTIDEAPTMRPIKIVHYTDLGVPPSIARPAVPQINVAREVAKIAAPPPAIAIPEPVADEKAQTQTIATVTEMAEALAPMTLDDLDFGEGGGDSLVIDLDLDYSPAPDDFIAVESEPVRISIDAPVYPEVAKTAGIEGTVTVRVLVGKDGKVKDVIYMDGPEGLKKAADDCARTAVFKPALMDHRPVEVWVLMPVTFKLRSR
jgi:protein TonB